MLQGNSKLPKPDQLPDLPPVLSTLSLVGFSVIAVCITVREALLLKQVHVIKLLDGYIYDPHDFKFDSNSRITQLALYSLLSGIIGGVVGTSGIVVLNLILYDMNMHPLIIANTS